MEKPIITSTLVDYKATIHIEATEGASIYYTIDDTEPTIESKLYTDNIIYPEYKNIKAIAVLNDEISEVSEYKCVKAIGYFVIRDYLNQRYCTITEPLDFCNQELSLPPYISFIGDGCIMNVSKLWLSDKSDLLKKQIYQPLNFDYNFINCGKPENIVRIFDKLLIIQDGILKIYSEKHKKFFPIPNNNFWFIFSKTYC